MNDDRGTEEVDGPSEAALAQLYRGELGRSDRWRTRLDTTSNWALTTTAAVISFGFSSTSTTHVVILVGIWMVVTFLIIEARRYRYYDLWNRRVRLLEDGFWAPLLRREPVDPDSLRELALELERPHLQLSFLAAVQTRLNRAYGSLLLVLFLAWFGKIFGHPTPTTSLAEAAVRAHVGHLSGWLVSGVLSGLFVAFVLLFFVSLVTRAPLGELKPKPRSRKRSIWEALYRPYARRAPRRRDRAAPTQH